MRDSALAVAADDQSLGEISVAELCREGLAGDADRCQGRWREVFDQCVRSLLAARELEKVGRVAASAECRLDRAPVIKRPLFLDRERSIEHHQTTGPSIFDFQVVGEENVAEVEPCSQPRARDS
jgi:hypothetical protein